MMRSWSLHEMQLYQDVAHVVGGNDNRHADNEPAADAYPGLNFRYLGDDACLRSRLVLERVIEEDLVLFVPGEARTVDIQSSSENNKERPNGPHQRGDCHTPPPGREFRSQIPAGS